MEHSKEAKDFFELFREVRDDLTNETGYYLADAIMQSFDRWNSWKKEMPEFDGDYLCKIERQNECGTNSAYQQVCQCIMNVWVLKDMERVMGWRKLSSEDGVLNE